MSGATLLPPDTAGLWVTLNANGPAIQALAAVATVLLTFVLACATIRYVRLTNRQADTAGRALELDAEKERLRRTSQRQRVAALAGDLLEQVRNLGQRVRTNDGITEQDLFDKPTIRELRDLSIEIGGTAMESAAAAVPHLDWLHGHASQAIAGGAAQHRPDSWAKLPDWQGHVDSAAEHLLSAREAVSPK